MLLLGGLPFIIARAVTKKTIVVKAWPFCDRCVRRRWIGAVATGLLVAAGIVTAIVGLALVDSQGDWAFWAGSC